MFLPLGDSPNPRGTPVVNYALIAINVAVYLFLTLPLSWAVPEADDPALRPYVEFLVEHLGRPTTLGDLVASISAYDLFVFRHGFRPAEPSFVTLLTSMFLHGGLMHLAGNMLFLWIYGDNVEHRLGRLGYLAAYLATGAAATLTHAAFATGSNVPMVGASGAISGALGFYFLFFPHNKVRVFVALFPLLVDVVTVPARWVLGFYLLIDNLLPFIAGAAAGGGGVAHGAHIGGFVAGLGAAWWIDRRERVARPREYRRGAPAPRPVPGGTFSIASLLHDGRFGEAAQVYFANDGENAHGVAPTDALVLARWLAENGHPSAALSVFRRLTRLHPRGPVAAEAHVGAGFVQLRSLNRPATAWQHFLDAIDVDPGGASEAQARQGLRTIEAQQQR